MSSEPHSSKAQLAVSSIPAFPCGDSQSNLAAPEHPRSLLPATPGVPVLHDRFGLGRISNQTPDLDDNIVVQFANTAETVPCASLRHLVPVTKLARFAEATDRVTAWTVRK